ncbi:hypothetical protein [Streptomyces sp. NPDC051636]
MHWFTDVVGGRLFAAGWLGVCVCAGAWRLPAGLVTDGAPPRRAAQPAQG